MTPTDVEALHRRASRGEGDAQMALARVLDHEGRHDQALQWLQRAADGGHLPSLTVLGARLFSGRAAPQMPSQGARMLSMAAEAGDAQACALVAVLAASGQMVAQSWSTALDYLLRAAQLGDARARRQIALLAGDPKFDDHLKDPADPRPWAVARAAIDIGAWLRPAAPRRIAEAPRLFVFESFLPASVCAWIVALARTPIATARTRQPGRDEAGPRPAAVGFALLDTDVVLQVVHARIAHATGIPPGQHQPTGILHFAVGEASGAPAEPSPGRGENTRVATMLIHLNDDFEGGETEFLRAGLRFRGRTGDAIAFSHVDKAGVADGATQYVDRAPTTGEKWLLAKGLCGRPQPQF